jgi:hypothetical protein
VTLDERLELPAIDGCQQLAENARCIAHAPFLFLSLANQKIDGKAPSYGACACGISIHPTTSPDSPARGGRGRVENSGCLIEDVRMEQEFFLSPSITGERIEVRG